MLRRLVFLFLFALAGVAAAPPDFPTAVVIAPSRTSIYIGAVTLTMPPLPRVGGAFTGTYSARVFPYFFYNEAGKFAIEVSDDALRQLASGATIPFHGQATSEDGEARRIEGQAAPIDGTSGRIKVRIFISKRIDLIFNTTYRLLQKS